MFVINDKGEIIDFVTEYVILEALKEGKGLCSIKKNNNLAYFAKQLECDII